MDRCAEPARIALSVADQLLNDRDPEDHYQRRQIKCSCSETYRRNDSPERTHEPLGGRESDSVNLIYDSASRGEPAQDDSDEDQNEKDVQGKADDGQLEVLSLTKCSIQ